ncbi:MAG TPA: DUF4386 domain-containing protein [Pyrinomonadaceae bacterium]
MKALTESPRFIARIAGLFYVLVFVAGIYSLFDRSSIGLAAGMVAGVFYIAVTVLFYFIFKPVSRAVSLTAAIVSLAGIVIGPLSFAVKPLAAISPLVFFGVYCSLIAYLIFRSTFLPRFLGVLMAFAGLGWLTFLSQSFALSLSPYTFLPGIIGEGALTLWLVVFAVNEERWKEQLASSER